MGSNTLRFRTSDLVESIDTTRRLAEATQFGVQVDAFLECSVGSLMHVLPAQLQRALQLSLVNSLQQHHSSQMLLDTSAGLSALSVPHSAPYLMQVNTLPEMNTCHPQDRNLCRPKDRKIKGTTMTNHSLKLRSKRGFHENKDMGFPVFVLD